MSEEKNTNPNDSNTLYSQGWKVVKACNEALGSKNYLAVRQQLVEYFKLGISKSGKLHSAILSIAVKLGTLTTEFHLVPFLNIWGIENIRPEDGEAFISEDGKRVPSLVERLAKAYAYALLFHPTEHIEPELENMFFPHLQKKGFLGVPCPKVVPLMATRLIQKDVRGRKMTFISLIASNGTEFMTEVHTLTAFHFMRYDDIPGTIFDTMLRTSQEKGQIRIEAAIPTRSNIEDSFPSKVGYIEFIDKVHGHIHIYDSESRHLVAECNTNTTISKQCSNIKVGDYVAFTPIIPKTSNFKTAFVRRILSHEEGPSAFGFRKAKVTFLAPVQNTLTTGESGVNSQAYVSWELLPDEDGIVHPIIETNTTEPSFTKGYINQATATALGKSLPKVGTVIKLIVYLKRGRDKQKRPHVIYFE